VNSLLLATFYLDL